MAKWKLTRLKFGTEEYTLTEGEKVTVGRGINNVITLSSVVISRNHCVIHVQNNKALITDLQVYFTYFSAISNFSDNQVLYNTNMFMILNLVNNTWVVIDNKKIYDKTQSDSLNPAKFST